MLKNRSLVKTHSRCSWLSHIGGGQGSHLSLIPRKKHRVTLRFLSHRVTYCSFLGVKKKRAAIATDALFIHILLSFTTVNLLSRYLPRFHPRERYHFEGLYFQLPSIMQFFFSASARKAGRRACLSITAGVIDRCTLGTLHSSRNCIKICRK